ncbi:MAG: alpha-amylase domain-containing protein, partial [Ferruginibacter sp.]
MKKWILAAGLFLLAQKGVTQQVFMQGWYWDYPKTAGGFSWADTLRIKAASLKAAGITHIWFPPHAVASFGPNSNGYDPKDLFIGNQTTGLGTRTALDNMLAEFTAQGIAPVADLIYNHRDGGTPENNPAVKAYINTYYTAAKEPYPSDRYRCILPIGGATGNGAGDYYFKFASKTGDNRFNNFGYKIYMQTNTVGYQGLPDLNESEPNGGGDCSQPDNDIFLGKNMFATVETTTGCNTDEFHLHLNAGDFNPAGDTIFIYMNNTGGYSDHRIYAIWCAPRGADIVNELQYQTYTNFGNMASGRGQMNYDFFKPNNANASTTYLNGDWDGMYFFYDYDQFQQKTADSLIAWTKWNWDQLGVRGLRMDAVKHFTPAFVGHMLDSMHNAGKDPSLVVGEWYSTNTAELSGWITSVKANMSAGAQAAINPKIFDFALREQLRQACDNSGYDCRNIFNGSLHDAASLSGYHIITFVNNHDFRDASGFASLVRNDPNLAYVYILTNNQLGVPTIFYPDYYGYPLPSVGLYSYHPTNLPPYKTEIDKLIAVLKNLINGSPSADYLNRFGTPYSSNYISGSADKCLLYQLQGFAGNGNRDIIVAINFGNTTLKVDQQINNRGGALGTGTRFNDILGRSAFPYQLVDASGRVYVELPPRSYSVWVQHTGTLSTGLLQLTGRVQGSKVLLNWNVTNETTTDQYLVERSADGLNFTQIGQQAALNPVSGVAAYSFADANPPAAPYL